jgi:hypothetical protein
VSKDCESGHIGIDIENLYTGIINGQSMGSGNGGKVC